MQPTDTTLTTPGQPLEREPRASARQRPDRRLLAGLRERVSAWHVALAGVLALAAVLNFRRLSQNGYANFFYSAGVKSELLSLHNFLFVSSDPGGLITIDKPPLGMWLQVVSAKIFGFSPMSLLAPEAVLGVLSVGLLYLVVARYFGRGAGVASALALAVYPSFVAISRDNGPDPLLLALMLLSCAAALRAIETASWRWLLSCAVLVGLAFNTKTLAALLVVPAIALAYLVCGGGRTSRRLIQLTVAGVVLVVISGAWISFVDLTPASRRPFVGSSTDNSEFNLTFAYNGFGRVGGQTGGPGQIPVIPVPSFNPVTHHSSHRSPSIRHRTRATGSAAATRRSTARARRPSSASSHAALRAAQSRALAAASPKSHQSFATSGVQPIPVSGHAVSPSSFGGAIGLRRLFSLSLGGQDGWVLPFAAFGMLAIALSVRRRRDLRLAALLVLGGWFFTEAVLLSFSKGIVHPYYVSAIGPGMAAMVGAGAWAMSDLARRLRPRRAVLAVLARLALPALAAVTTVIVQHVLLRREHYLHAYLPFMYAAVIVGLLAIVAVRRLAAPAIALVLAALLVAPTAYASTVWDGPVTGTFPAAGPHAAEGVGGLGLSSHDQTANTRLIAWVSKHHPGTRWSVLTVASDTAAPIFLMGTTAGSLGGYSGNDPAISPGGLARLVRLGEARYVLLGGAYSDRGGNAAITAVRQDCLFVPSEVWRHTKGGGVNGFTLFDCRHGTAKLAAAPNTPPLARSNG
jgi:4-amino-4-deoxy-L-arabinose transferase-like glycosyltransferase